MTRLSVNLGTVGALPTRRETGCPSVAEAAALAAGADGALAFEADGAVLGRCRRTARAAAEVGLAVHAGHDPSLDNPGSFLRAVPGCTEVSIGHVLVADALRRGWQDAVGVHRDAFFGAAAARAREA